MTWRVIAHVIEQIPTLAGHDVWVKRAAAVGLLQQFWSAIAEHTTDGRVAQLPDAQLEEWAGYAGPPGLFAAWFRAHHLDVETGKPREWDDMNGALAERRAKDARRKAEQRDRERQLAAAAAARALDRHEGRGGQQMLDVVDPLSPTHIGIRLTTAANVGMHDNPAIGEAYNPINGTTGDVLILVEALGAEGVATAEQWELMRGAVYTIAKRYKPQRPGDQIHSMRYFEARLVNEWRKRKARLDAERAERPVEIPVDADTPASTVRPLHTKRQRAAAGALVAARAVNGNRRA